MLYYLFYDEEIGSDDSLPFLHCRVRRIAGGVYKNVNEDKRCCTFSFGRLTDF